MVLASSLKNLSVTTSSRRRSSIGFCSVLSTSNTSFASIITWGNERCVTWFSCGSRMQFWNRNQVESVQITMAENFGVQGRGAFYDQTGAIRDVVQNHLFQILANLAME